MPDTADAGTPIETTERELQVLAAVDDAETLDLLVMLVSCPSEEPPGNELRAAELLAERLAPRATDCRLVEVVPNRPNVIATLGEDGPTVVLNGHLDTVPVGEGWSVDPFGAEIRDGLLYGRGACDMKAGVAAMSAAFLAVERSGIPLAGRVAVHAVIGEESIALGSRHAAATEPADWVIVTEASAGDVRAFGNGQLNLEIVFEGKAVHSSRPEQGRNAIHDAAAFIARIEAEHERMAAHVHPGIGPATYSVGLIDGGLGGTIVADRCTVTLDRRVLPTETLDEAEEAVVALLRSLEADRPGLRWTMRRTLEFPTLPGGAETDRLAEVIADASEAVGAPRPGRAGIRAATDAAWYSAAGRNVVVFGPGDGGTAHQVDEHVRIDDVLEVTRILAVTIARLLEPAA